MTWPLDACTGTPTMWGAMRCRQLLVALLVAASATLFVTGAVVALGLSRIELEYFDPPPDAPGTIVQIWGHEVPPYLRWWVEPLGDRGPAPMVLVMLGSMAS